MQTAGLRLINLEKKDVATGGTPILQLSVINPKTRVRGFLLRALLTIVQGAGAAAIPGTNLSRIFSSIMVGKRLRGTGRSFDTLNWLMNGFDINLPADVPAAAATYKRMVELFIPIADGAAYEPGDTAAHSRLFADEQLELGYSEFATVFGANSTITGKLKSFAVVDDGDARVIATPTRVNFTDLSGGSVLLPRGDYSYVWLYREDGTKITSLELPSITVSVDGEVIAKNLSIDDLTSLWNLMRSRGASVQTASETVPAAGEQLEAEPGAAAGAADTVSAAIVPLVFGPDRYKLPRLVSAESQLQIDYEGTPAGIRVGYRTLEQQGPIEVEKAKRKQGVSHLTGTRNKTAGKSEPSSERSQRLLNKRAVSE